MKTSWSPRAHRRLPTPRLTGSWPVRSLGWVPIILVMMGVAPASAQGEPPVIEGTEAVSFDRPEAWAMKWFTSVTLFTSLAPPRTREAGSVDLAFELDWIPSLTEDQRRVGFNGTKVEDINRLPVLPRPRVAIGLGRKLTAEAAWIPPVEVEGLTPNIIALALERPLAETGNWSFGGRLYGQYGVVEGDITCTAGEATIPPGSPGNDFGCQEPSRDEVTIAYAGLAVTAGYHVPGTRDTTLHFGVYGTHMDLAFQVDALTYGLRDRTRLETDGWTAAVTAGVGFALSERFRLGIEAFYTPLDVVRPPETGAENDPLFNLRSMLSYSF